VSLTADDLVQAVLDAGAQVKFSGRVPRLVGEVPAEVLQGIKDNREEFIDAWEKYERDRYCKIPPDNLPLRSQPPKWRRDVYRRVEGYVRRQTDGVVQWAFARGDEYLRKGWSSEDATRMALMDVLYWQLGRHKSPEFVLMTISECVKDWNEKMKMKGVTQ
jgi:hypothetical protein